MNKIKHAARAMASLSIYKGILNRTVPQALYRLLWSEDKSEQEFLNAWGAFFNGLCERGSSENSAKCIAQAAMYDENVFSRASAAGETDFSQNLLDAVERDLNIILEISSITPADFLSDSNHGADVKALALPQWKIGEPAQQLQGDLRECILKMEEYYRNNGCGMYANYRAFIWRGKQICPVAYPDKTKLSDLKGYEVPRGLAIENTLAFLNGFPANNCLLYGDRGTGKSSTVKALLNEFYSKGLRIIEMPKKFLSEFPLLVDRVAALPMKFIVFIDDLSFSKEDDTYASLKAVLEGGLAARPENTLIYATSNRRHLVRENFSDREGDEIHRGDTIQESLSLADGFGLAINFSLPGKDEFLDIVRRLARQRDLNADMKKLEAGAEKWAISRGGRSPRCAKQYIRMAEAKIRSKEQKN